MPAWSATTVEQDLLTVALWVAKTVGAPLHDPDLVGDAFGKDVGDAIVEVGEHRVAPPLQGAPHDPELLDTGGVEVCDPTSKRRSASGRSGVS